MKGFQFAVTCPRCGADLDVVTVGKVYAGTETSAILRCTECRGIEWHVMVAVLPVVEHLGVTNQRRIVRHGQWQDLSPMVVR